MAEIRDPTSLDTGWHDRRHARRLEDPGYRAEFTRQKRRIAAIDVVINELDELRKAKGLSKAGSLTMDVGEVRVVAGG